MSKITYIHNNLYFSKLYKRSTIALELPTSKELIKCAKYMVEVGAVHFPLMYGLTFVSPKDQFNKKIGRDEAKKKMSLKTIEVLSVLADDISVTLQIKLQEDKEIYFKVYQDSKKVRVTKSVYSR